MESSPGPEFCDGDVSKDECRYPHLEETFIVEVCCGTAGFTAAARAAGFRDTFGVNHIRPWHVKAPVVCLDITVNDSQRVLLKWLESPRCRGILIAPPCGTASASRNIRLDHLPGGGPKPLDEPEGIYPLSFEYRKRVEAANLIYLFVQTIVETCCALKIPVVVETPLNSLYWDTRWWRLLSCSREMLYAKHQACAYGSRRPKNAMLAFNRSAFLEICGMCPGDHEHLPWGLVGNKWATSMEVHYPPGLCRALARCFLKCAIEDTYSCPQQPSTRFRSTQEISSKQCES